MNYGIYEVLRDRILFLEYAPGSILNEKVLAEEFGVSRTPLRDVLNYLEWEHLVRILPRTGTLVTEIELQRIMNVFQVRFGIEDMVWRLATEQFTTERREKMEALLEECAGIKEKKDRKAMAGIDAGLRALFSEAVNNPILTEISDRLYRLTFRLWYIMLDKGDWKEEVINVEKELTAIINALKSGDPEKVGRTRKEELKKHLNRMRYKFFE